MGDVVFSSGEVVVNAENVVTGFYEALTEMRAEKTCSACNKNSFHCSALDSVLIMKSQSAGGYYTLRAGKNQQGIDCFAAVAYNGRT